MPSEFNPAPRCPYCTTGGHSCVGCQAILSHSDCDGKLFGICDDCQPLMQARP